MMRRIDDRLRGVFRGSHAIAAGAVTEHQLRSARFTRLVRDVYMAAGPPVSHELRCHGARLIMPEEAAFTGRSAATIRGVALARPWDPIEIVVAERDRFGPLRGFQVRRVLTASVPAEYLGGLRVASAERMVFDLANRTGRFEAVADLDEVLRAELVQVTAVDRHLVASHERDVRRVRRVWRLADGRAESRPESRLRVLLGSANLWPVPQLEVFDRLGLVARVDLGFPERCVAVEYDGAWHADAWQLRRDRRRLNRLREAGWEVVFVTADLLWGDPRAVVGSVRAALSRRDKPAYRAS